MLALNHSLMNRESYCSMYSEGLGSDHFYMQSPCNPLVKDYTEVFYTIHKWNILSAQCEMNFMWSKSMREVDGTSFIFIDFNVPVFIPCLN
jgi:hypothetical protein